MATVKAKTFTVVDNNKEYETADVEISSNKPFIVKRSDEYGILSYRTFLPQVLWECDDKYALPIKLEYDEEDLYQMTFYLPTKDIITMLHNTCKSPDTCLVNLWIWFDDGSLIINYVDLCEPEFDSERQVMFYRIALKNTGFDSEEKRLDERFQDKKEICQFVLDKFLNHNIVEIMPNIKLDELINGGTVYCLSNTVEPFNEALASLDRARNSN